MKNSFAMLFANFIKEMWAESKDTINPRDLRNSLIKKYSQFDNNFQQDAHEVLTLILDTLHGQLNRVKNDNQMIICDEPAYDTSMALAKSLSQVCWNSHNLVNNSFIVDTFFGQLKSSIYCLNCNKTYFTFDPFSSLGLPIPNVYKILIYLH